jgi:hypothetical protein
MFGVSLKNLLVMIVVAIVVVRFINPKIPKLPIIG